MTQQTIKYNPNYAFVFKNLKKRDIRYIILEGGTRSGKTYSTLAYIIRYCEEFRATEFAVVRKTLAALKLTALKDFEKMLKECDLYHKWHHNKTEHTFEYNGNKVYFFGADNDDKLRGFACDILYLNEGLEIDSDEWLQLKVRTRHKIILDYNPSATSHYLYDELDSDESSVLLRTTYQDNPHLPLEQVKEIEKLKVIDDDLYKIYAKGERGQTVGIIFNNWQISPSVFPTDGKKFGYAMDFGFTNDPTSLVQCCVYEGKIWIDELIFETGMTNGDISERMKELGVNQQKVIIADSAEPKSIEELKRLRWRVVGVKKGSDSIRHSINTLKKYKINVTSRSKNVIRELKSYKWRQMNGESLNEPVDKFNHSIDAIRYWAISELDKNRVTYDSESVSY